MNKVNYYLFLGQNASTGQPHKLTGHYSFYGEILRFDSAKERRAYWDWSRYYPIMIKGGKKAMRKFCLGSSYQDFEDYLNHVPTMKLIDSSWEPIFPSGV